MRRKISRPSKVKSAKKSPRTKQATRGRRLSLKDLAKVTGGQIGLHVCCS